MPVFNVIVQRETVREIKVRIEAESLEDITTYCPSHVIYEGIDAMRNSQYWNPAIDDFWLDPDKVKGTTGQPEFVLVRIDGNWTLKKAPKKQLADPRQLPLLLEDPPEND